MPARKKTAFIQTAFLFISVIFTALVILYNMGYYDISFINRPTDKSGVSSQTPNTSISAQQKTEYDPLNEIQLINIADKENSVTYSYSDEIKNYQAANPLVASGWSLTDGSYNGTEMKFSLVLSGIDFEKEYSKKQEETEKVVSFEAQKGGYSYSYEKVSADCPLLRPYYGYIIYTSSDTVKLLDSMCRVLVNNFSGYTPAYCTDNAGHPLFKKDNKYYFYYDGKESSSVVYDNITEDTFETLPENAPDAYRYFLYDMDILMNYYASDMSDNSHYLTGIVMSLPEKPGMAEYIAEENEQIDLKLCSSSYGKSAGELFRFAEHRYTKEINNQEAIDAANKLIAAQTAAGEPVTAKPVEPTYTITEEGIYWGYMDKDRNVVIEPQYKAAYEFSKDGLAVVVDLDNKVCVIDKNGTVKINAYKNIVNFAALGGKKIRDGYYTPDTYGIENMGMFFYDHGYVRMRRKLVDTAYGYVVKRETDVLVSTSGSYFNYPSDYKLVSYSNGMLLLEKNGLYGYMNYAGEWVVQPKLVYAQPFCEGLAVVGYSKNKLGVIDTCGNIIMPMMYQKIENCSGGIITAFNYENGWTVYNKLTKTAPEANNENPVLSLKTRAIAEAKNKFYKAASFG